MFAPGGQGKSAPIDPHDISSVAAKALATPGHEGKRYVLTGEEILSAAEQVDILGAALGRPLRFVDVPEAGARAGMLKAGMDEVMVDALMELMSRVRTGSEALRTTTVRDMTDVARRTFAEWVKNHLAAFE